jgi:hypothetical protein
VEVEVEVKREVNEQARGSKKEYIPAKHNFLLKAITSKVEQVRNFTYYY